MVFPLATGVDPVIPEPAADRALEPVYEFIGVSPPGIVDLFIAIGLLVASWFFGRWLVRNSGRSVARRFERPSVTRTVLQLIHISVVAVALLIAARIVGFSPGEILLSVTVFSAVLAVVLAPVVRRLVSGVFVLTDRPYEIGDMIELVDTETRGFVEDVTLRYTKLFTLENTFIVIPNSEILDRDIINYSAEDERIRQTIFLEVTYGGDLDRARALAVAAATEVDGVISDGPPIRVGSTRFPAEPRCLIDEFADDGVLLQLTFWVQHPYHLPRVRSAVQERLWTMLEKEPVEIAYPHREISFAEDAPID